MLYLIIEADVTGWLLLLQVIPQHRGQLCPSSPLPMLPSNSDIHLSADVNPRTPNGEKPWCTLPRKIINVFEILF